MATPAPPPAVGAPQGAPAVAGDKANERKAETDGNKKDREKKKMLLQMRTEEYAGMLLAPPILLI